MAAVYGLLGLLLLLLLVILLLLVVPVYGRIVYDGALRVRVRVLGIPVTLLPTKPKSAPAKKSPKKKKKPAGEKDQKSAGSKLRGLGEELSRSFREDGVTATLDTLGRLARLAGQAAGGVLRACTVDRLRLELRISTGDAADTAVRYGQVCAALYPSLAVLSHAVRVRRRQVRVEPNFLQESSDARLDVRLHIAVWRVLWALLRFWLGFVQTAAGPSEKPGVWSPAAETAADRVSHNPPDGGQS